MGGQAVAARTDPLALFEAHRDAAYGVARRVTGAGPDDLEDIVGEAFEEVFREIGRGVVVASLPHFVYGVTGRVCLRYLRRRARLARMVRRLVRGHAPHPPPETPATSAERAETVDSVQRALLGLPPLWRAMVVMHHIEEVPICEIARDLGLREGTVKSRLFRARDALRRQLGPHLFANHEEVDER